MPADVQLLVLWERLTGEILDRTALFPRNARFTFAARIDGRALDVLSDLTLARYAARAEQAQLLRSADAHLAVLRTLLRLAADRSFLSLGALEALSRGLAEAGRMLGGWRSAVGAAP